MDARGDAWDCAVGCPFAVCAFLARMRAMCRSRRTIMFVIGTGQSPLGSTLCLHMGHSEELRSRKVSMQSGWKIWRQGSSRTCVSLGSKSSRQMGQVGCDHEVDMPDVGTAGTDERRNRGEVLGVSGAAEEAGKWRAWAGGWGAGFSGSSEVLAVYVYMGSLSRTCCETVRRLTPSASRSTSPLRTRWRRALRRLRWMMCMAREVMLTATRRIAMTMTRKTQRLGSWPPDSVLTVAHRRM